MSVMIGIDPHKGSHAAAAVNGHEEAMAELEVRATRRQTSELLAWAERFPVRRWAIESANGHGYLLAQQLVAAGEHVVDVPSTLSARVRVLDSTRSQKNDANDARSVAVVALRQPNLRVVTAEGGILGRWVVGLGRCVVAPSGSERVVAMEWMPCLVRSETPGGGVRVGVGHEVVDDYLEFVAARCRPNTVLAAGFDLKVFFTTVPKDPTEVTTGDVLGFITAQRATGDPTVVRLSDGESGLSARTIQRRLSSLSGMFAFLVARGDVAANPVPKGLSTRRSRERGGRGVPLVRTPRTLPRVVDPAEVDGLLAACRTLRDRAMFEAMVLGGLRRCEVLGLRLEDLDAAQRQVFIAEGKGGHQRRIPISARWFVTVGDYLRVERPREAATDRVFVVLKGPHRGQPLSDEGLKQVFVSARQRAGLRRITCHELRHTCFTRLREAGMELEALQAQAGHRSIETTRLYVHLANEWLAEEYHQAAAIIDADLFLAAAEEVGH